MKQQLMALAALCAGAGAVHAQAVMPSDVMFADGVVAASLSGQPGDPAEGKLVMASRGLGNCVACHEVTALAEFPFHGNVGPTLDGVADRWTEEELRGIVTDAKQMFDGTMMPSFYKNAGYIRPGNDYTGKAAKPEDLTPMLSAQQVEDVVAYLMTLKEN